MSFKQLAVIVIIFTIVILIGYKYIKKYLLDKVKLNKWIIILIAVIFWVIPPIIKYSFPKASLAYWPYIFYTFSIIFFLWFIDLILINKKKDTDNVIYRKPDKKKEMINKPKAKPNRVKK